MKILFLSDVNSIHTQRWVLSLAELGHQIFLFSFSNVSNDKEYRSYVNIEIHCCGINNSLFFSSKIAYIAMLHKLKKIISCFAPDILHAHYASSYGLLGALTGFHPYVISVWGSDVYDFPQKNIFTKQILEYNLKKADYILSTSHVMAKETKKYTNKKIMITPFGVDTSAFKGQERAGIDSRFIIGNVKTLSPKYGIDILIRAYKIIVERNPKMHTSLVIIGDGPCRKEYEYLAEKLGLQDLIQFRGKVPNNKLPEYYNNFSVFVSTSVSNSESFGVVAVEAMACECPVVTSDADGFTEVVEDGQTGFIVPKKDVEATAKAIQKFIDEPDLRATMGKKGRERVLALYDWNDNVRTMLEIYNEILK